ncbi:unnamed protein product [Onchocerca flexuosa]|uniref:Col_cuticle_N domain-containing protein n=1 Tax=Onchocerca flexuosa TaxID=387005 RepID=A0A183HR78_9BILA|nr:unnamed protein product [Onchocerca flexuosa]
MRKIRNSGHHCMQRLVVPISILFVFLSIMVLIY